ncbi:MAG: M20/M25/M40 family metallo-hydrolase [Candidatus Solibacter sp.]|jgi:acetylornithine deacetylase/succinyl-diaminopimelate desuccinylase-like protein
MTGRLAIPLLALAGLAGAQTGAQNNPAAQAARAWRETHERAILGEFLGLLALPNLARDTEGIRRNAAAVSALFEKRGVKTRLLEVPGAPPVVYGEIPAPGATRTIVFYAHYDGQPLDPKEWATPPWEPVVRDRAPDKDGRVISLPAAGKIDPEWRIYARSASDDKAPLAAISTALNALKAAGIAPRSQIKFVFEGEEEAGSPHLAQIVAKYKDLLGADVWLICDGPVHQSRRPQIVFGARGITGLDITLYGASHELHSGHYGNWAPNPAMALARLLASMKDDDGRVLIDHFYDGIEPLTDTEKRAIAEAPEVDAALMRELSLGRTEGGGRKLVELINLPSLNVRGMASARVGDKASNVVPATATASIDIRLVKGIDPATAVRRVLDHIRKQGYEIVETEPDAATRMQYARLARVTVEPGYKASRTSIDLPISQLVLRTAESARGPVVRLPTMGGSVPLYMIEDILHAPTITVPIANHDNNQHSFNENIRIQNLWDGIELMAALLAM